MLFKMHIVLQDIGSRPYMEDTCIVSEKFMSNLDLYCVFDGHGGDFVANFLRDNFENILKEIIRENKGTINDMLFMSIHKLVSKLPIDAAQRCGSTLLIALRYGEVVYIANAGDCRAVMDVDGTARSITQDHKPDSDREKERVYKYGGHVTPASQFDVARVNGNLAVSRSIGDVELYPMVTWVPDIYIVRLRPGVNKFMILASDGVWDTVSSEDAVDIFNYHLKDVEEVTKDHLAKASKQLLITARQRGSGDNITICAFML